MTADTPDAAPPGTIAAWCERHLGSLPVHSFITEAPASQLWGFELEDVLQPFDVFYGDADQIISPQMPIHVAERLPRATLHVWPGAGHYGFVDRDRWAQFWAPLSAGDRMADQDSPNGHADNR